MENACFAPEALLVREIRGSFCIVAKKLQNPLQFFVLGSFMFSRAVIRSGSGLLFYSYLYIIYIYRLVICILFIFKLS